MKDTKDDRPLGLGLSDGLDAAEAQQASYCRYGVCRPGEKHAAWCTEYAPGELRAAAILAQRELDAQRHQPMTQELERALNKALLRPVTFVDGV